jgi:hypothetical protein
MMSLKSWICYKYVYYKIFFKFIHYQLIQYLYSTVSHLGHGNLEITYILHSKIYKIKTKIKKGPNKIVSIRNRNYENVTENVLMYMGPNEDFHGQDVTPSDLGFDGLYFIFRNKHGKYFSSNQIIHI